MFFLLLIELFLLFLKVTILKFLSGFSEGSITFILLLITLLLDLLKRHANDSLLEASGFSSLLTLDLINFDFLVEASPGLSPGELDRFDFLVIEGSNLGGYEIVDFTIL